MYSNLEEISELDFVKKFSVNKIAKGLHYIYIFLIK